MVGREDTESIYSIGSGKLSTELYELVERVNSETVNLNWITHLMSRTTLTGIIIAAIIIIMQNKIFQSFFSTII